MALTRERLRELCRARGAGCRPPRPAAPRIAATTIIEYLTLQLGDTPVRGILTRPTHIAGRARVILYGHSHGGRYDIGADELLDGREYLLDPLGPVFARQGYVTLCIDMPTFGKRSTESESFASKALLWYGKGLFAADALRPLGRADLPGVAGRRRPGAHRGFRHLHGLHAELLAGRHGRAHRRGGASLLLCRFPYHDRDSAPAAGTASISSSRAC